METGWDLRRWIVEEHATPATRFERSVGTVVPLDRWRDPAGDGGSSIAWLVFHTAYHEDLAVNGVVRAAEPLILQWRSALGVDGFAPHAGLGEAEDSSLTAVLDLDQLRVYAQAVHDCTTEWMWDVDLGSLDVVPASSDGLISGGISDSDVPWLYSMWAEQPVSFFVRWEATGHRMQHVGEMVSVRNRLGLSPF